MKYTKLMGMKVPIEEWHTVQISGKKAWINGKRVKKWWEFWKN